MLLNRRSLVQRGFLCGGKALGLDDDNLHVVRCSRGADGRLGAACYWYFSCRNCGERGHHDRGKEDCFKFFTIPSY